VLSGARKVEVQGRRKRSNAFIVAMAESLGEGRLGHTSWAAL
jgi:hypothetical protein